MKKKLIPVLVAMALLVLVAAVGVGTILFKKHMPSTTQLDASEYYGTMGQDEVVLVLQDQISDHKGKLIDGKVYLDYETVSTLLNKRFYWDKAGEKLLYTTPTDIISIPINTKTYQAEGKEKTVDYTIFSVEGDTGYLALAFIEQYTNMQFEQFESPNKVVIQYKWGNLPTVTTKEESCVRLKGGIKSDILTSVAKDTDLFLLEELDTWSKVATKDGFIGYIEKKTISEVENKNYEHKGFEEPIYTTQKREHKINMVWHQVTAQAANATLGTALSNSKGVNTVSPTWFSVKDNQGNISSLFSEDYVKQAHQMGIEVWGLVDNFSKEVNTLTLLSDSTARANLINQLVQAATTGGLDGINVDFESLKEETGPHFIQFIRELSIQCRKNKLVLSIDNPVPQNYTSFYNRKEQGVVADYVIIMGYDEHFKGSEKPGSVASLPFVKRGIDQTLEEVPADKVINGIPTYTRLWKASDQGAVTSEVLGMNQAATYITENKVETYWDEKAGQNYGELSKDGATYKIWIEDEKSIEEKMKLISESKLAGVAQWKLGMESPVIWDVISKYMK